MAAFLCTTGGACLLCSACAFASSFSWKRILREAPDAASMKLTRPVSFPELSTSGPFFGPGTFTELRKRKRGVLPTLTPEFALDPKTGLPRFRLRSSVKVPGPKKGPLVDQSGKLPCRNQRHRAGVASMAWRTP